ncbi:MAG: serine/threonine-protein kinase [Pyrinomonadaceae bacterium]
MDAKRLKQIEVIYHAALETPYGQRESFLTETCGKDENLFREVKSLLAFDKTSDSFIDTSPESLAAEMFSPPANNSSLIGKEISHYSVKSLLGVGGMGEVYLADDHRLNRKVALKLLPREFVEHNDQLKRFEQEAQASSALNHPNILTIHEFGSENGSNYIVTEFVDGVTLRERMASGLSVNETLEAASQIASALAAAHEAGIIHRDIKPENIMIRRDGIVKVLDFGLAKLAEKHPSIHLTDSEAPTRAHVSTNPGFVMGTAFYMSPEQVRGREIDERADIWSLGVVLYEMLTGQKPFTGDSDIEVMSAILKEEPQELTESIVRINPSLQKILRICLEKKPERRFHSAHDLGFALEALTSSSNSQMEMEFPVSVSSKHAKRSYRRHLPWLFAAGFAVVALAAGIYAWNLRSSQNEPIVFRQLNFRREAVFQAAFAPDGQTVIYSAATDGNTSELFTLHPDFPAPQPLGTRGMHLLDVSSQGELAILMDAKYIWHRTFTGTLARMPLVGGAPRQVLWACDTRLGRLTVRNSLSSVRLTARTGLNTRSEKCSSKSAAI